MELLSGLDSLFDELSDPEGTATGHIDTGLHTTYFLGKMLSGGMEEIVSAAADRADLIYAASMNPSWPSYSATFESYHVTSSVLNRSIVELHC